MSVIPQLCDQILKQLETLGRQTPRSMLPGLREDEIRRIAADLPFELPNSLIELYKWSEGLDPNCGMGSEFFPGYGMESLREMHEMYHDLSSAPDYPRFRCGDMRWFPIFRSGGTDFFAICCDAARTEDGLIIDDDNEGEHRDCITPPQITFASLEAMLRTLLRAYETGVYFVDENARLTYGVATYFLEGRFKGALKNVDISAFKEIARTFNPGVKEWE